MTRKRSLWMLVALFSTIVAMAGNKQGFLFSYFTGQKDGLHLAYSTDGLTWTPLFGGQSILRPEVGKDRLMRDPSICQGPDGTFHLVWTSSWHDRIIGYASSRDLIHWSEQRAIPVMEHEPTAKNCWAPEVFYDEPSGQFYILWATSIPGRHKEIPTSEQDKGNNHRIYCTTTRDFQQFSMPRLYFNPDFIAIDAAIVRDAKKKDYVMVVKNENSVPAEKNLRITRTKDLEKGFPVKVSKPINGNYWCEGPAPLFVGDTLYVYFDRYREGRYGAVRSLNHGRTWQDISDQVSFPKGTRHGTAFPVDMAVIDRLKQSEQSLTVKRRTRHFRVTDYPSLQAAIDAANGQGGGTVVVPKGTYETGALFFPKGIDLWLERGARLVGIVDTTLYPLVETRWEGDLKMHRAALLNFVDNDSCIVGGEGIIDGNGLEWAKWPKPETGRPRAVCFTRCHGGRISGVTIQNQAAWGLHVLFTHGFIIDNINIRMDGYVPSSDGIDIDSSTDIVIKRSDISAHDDCISIKSGRGEAARRQPLPSRRITVEDCRFGYGHGTVAIGSELSGGISDVVVRRCKVGDGNRGLVRIKSQPSRGGYVENVLFEDVTVENAKSLMDVNLAWRMIGPDSIPAPQLTQLKNITIRRVKGKAEQTGNIIGYASQPIPRNVFRFEECEIVTGKLLDIQYADIDTIGLKQNITTK